MNYYNQAQMDWFKNELLQAKDSILVNPIGSKNAILYHIEQILSAFPEPTVKSLEVPKEVLDDCVSTLDDCILATGAVGAHTTMASLYTIKKILRNNYSEKVKNDDNG